MLVKTLKTDEAIRLDLPNGQQIRILIVDIRGSGEAARVRIGTDADREIIIHHLDPSGEPTQKSKREVEKRVR